MRPGWIVVVLLFLHSCNRDERAPADAGVESTSGSNAKSAPSPRTVSGTLELRRYVVRVLCKTREGVSNGSAFIHHSGLAITAAHVINACDGPIILEHAGRTVQATVTRKNEVLDLALLKPARPQSAGLHIAGRSGSFRFGTTLVAFGYPSGFTGGDALMTVGYLAGLGKDGPAVRAYVNGSFNRGNSGGPVIDVESGLVVGVVASKMGRVPEDLRTAVSELAQRRRQGKNEDDIRTAQLLEQLVAHVDGNSQLGVGLMVTPGDLLEFITEAGQSP